VQIYHGEWTDPELGKVELRDYAEIWIAQRPGLRPRTSDLYFWLLRKHIAPSLGRVPLGKLSTAMIRQWRSELLGSGVSVSVAAKAYRLLRAVLTTAVTRTRSSRATLAASAELVTSRLGRGRCSPWPRSLSLPIFSAVVLSATSAR
jgi:Phage integrase, N-terminal SAM-like domain